MDFGNRQQLGDNLNNFQNLTNHGNLSSNFGSQDPTIQQHQQSQVVGKYVLGKILGTGRFGCVRLAVHIENGQRVAIKIIDKLATPFSTKKREAEILKVLNHRGVVSLYEVIETPTHLLLVTEYVEGRDLFSIISSAGRLSEDDARIIFLQLIEAVKYCHSRFIVHRDIKCENVLVCTNHHSFQNTGSHFSSSSSPMESVVVKLLDFGLSGPFQPHQKNVENFGGSLDYSSPEIIMKKTYIGPEVDVWSCGVLLFVMTCGTLPFQGESEHHIAENIKYGRYNLPPHLTPEIQSLIKSLLHPDANFRGNLAAIHQHPWCHMGRQSVQLVLHNSINDSQNNVNDNSDDMVTSSTTGTSSIMHPYASSSFGRQSLGNGQSQTVQGQPLTKRSISDSEVYTSPINKEISTSSPIWLTPTAPPTKRITFSYGSQPAQMEHFMRQHEQQQAAMFQTVSPNHKKSKRSLRYQQEEDGDSEGANTCFSAPAEELYDEALFPLEDEGEGQQQTFKRTKMTSSFVFTT